jgi:hypothetical protein
MADYPTTAAACTGTEQFAAVGEKPGDVDTEAAFQNQTVKGVLS